MNKINICQKEYEPYGPKAPGPNPFSTVSPCPPGFFFSGKTASQKKQKRISTKIGVFVEIVAILANVDLNSRFEICKIAI